ncbi:MAG: TAT-variant-translocated molybdopterin oxidoreductase, partial [Planctomycetota bacterium]
MTQVIDPVQEIKKQPDGGPVGAVYWRSIEQHLESDKFRENFDKEFPSYDPDEMLTRGSGPSRRRFMQLAAASMALAGLTLTGCRRWPQERLVPYASRPEGTIPGVPEHYATMLQRSGIGYGCTVIGVDGRPIKIEGNNEHPWAAGKTDGFMQAATLELYDPQRLRQVRTVGRDEATGKLSVVGSSWSEFDAWSAGHFAGLEGAASSGLAVLAEPMTGLTIDAVKAAMKKRFPGMSWYTWEPLNRDRELAGAKLAFGGDQALRPVYDVAKADIIALFDCDFFSTHPAGLQNAMGWAAGRRIEERGGKMNRVYSAAPGLTVSGASADVKLAVPAGQIEMVVSAVARELGVKGAEQNGVTLDRLAKLQPRAEAFVKSLVKDLKANKGKSLVVAGPTQPAEVHAACHAINEKLENIGPVVTLVEEPAATAEPLTGQVQELAERLNAGGVDTLLVIGGNAVFDAPADLGFGELMGNANHVVRLSLYPDETARRSGWVLPMAHGLESWGDALAWDGTVSLAQPLIHPIFNGRTPAEVLARLAGGDAAGLPVNGYDLVRKVHRDRGLPGGEGFEKNWRTALHSGFVKDSGLPRLTPKTVYAMESPALPEKLGGDRFELSFRGGALYDGRYANSGWLQEAPAPLTKATWCNPLLMSYNDAMRLGLKYGDVVTLSAGAQSIETPIYIMPGQADGAMVFNLGHGRWSAGSIGGSGENPKDAESYRVGVDGYPLRESEAMGFTTVTLAKTGKSVELPLVSNHHLLTNDFIANWAVKKRAGKKYDSGYVVKSATLDQYNDDPKFAKDGAHGNMSLQLYDPPMEDLWLERADEVRAKHPNEPVDEQWPPRTFNRTHAWGMAVDMNLCLGCNACVIACQAENNIPVVGERGVRMSREMHWLRIDTYFKPKYKNPDALAPGPDWSNGDVEVVHMPVSCLHCENAPCEQVCPVAATVHDTEGMNTMVYNRCIGTRYCSNNCPYKVRRYNYFDWH